jgi:DNA-binding NarL/FixJ family response regulator
MKVVMTKKQPEKTMTSNPLDDSPEKLGELLASRRPDLLEKLSPSQLKVLYMLLGGMSEPMIVEATERSKHTVHDHVKTIYRKFEIKRRVQLLLLFTHPNRG